MSSQPLRAVLFDWDGTLLDSYHADMQAYLGMFRALGVKWGAKEVDHHYSPNWHRIYRAAGIPRSRWREADRLWARHYRRQTPQLLPGALRVLKTLRRRYVLGLVTSGNRARIRRQMRQFRLTSVFSAYVCAEDARHRKPHPAPLQEALRRLRIAAGHCIYVGDAPEDMEMAHRAGVCAVAMLGPFPTHDRLRAARPRAVLASIRELPHFLRSLEED